ncbi:M20 metallopeptidase family protein [Goodfellowiella coeruleoviolacea]|uniref:Hippurate hydrolase n=1 Tax=Goodfellowiella coeruleoviolacea TaxID=334858 RepID=A0AAE3GA74_9PSEU|nr:M20 family metallopeptidase [Goodfellowiella coeruleoviolacea]MCP2164536.1 hippurate hydrolase [Goodfellowiella coeruleoviolacea]
MNAADARFTGLIEAARALQPRTVALRRQLHRHPEVGLQLPATQTAVLHALEGLPLRISTGTECTSVVAVLDGANPGPTVLLRADMDALPLTEETGLAYASETKGAMHACGHDTHTAMLASAARLLCSRRDALAGQVVFMFQPGEERDHGARLMIKEGVLEATGTKPSKALSLHITSGWRSGVVRSRPGPMMASADELRIRVSGKGGHGGIPHDAIDPVPAAAAMVGALQTVVSRRVNVFDPVVLTVASIRAGTSTNIIPETAELVGTIRTLAETTRTFVHREVKRICQHVAIAFGCTAHVEIVRGYPVSVNDDTVGAHVVELAKQVLGARCGEHSANPITGAEDFAYVLREVPGAIAFLGACPRGVDVGSAPPNHSNRVLFDEAAMEHGVALYAAFALDALR